MYGYLYNIEDGVVKQDLLLQQELELFIQLGPAPIVQIDYEQQPSTPLQQFQISYDDIDTLVIWPIPAFVGPYIVPPLMASSLVMSRRQRYWAPRAVMMEATGIELPQYAPGIVRTWDDVSENSKAQPEYYKDHLSDEGVEKMTLPDYTWDVEFEYSKLQAEYYKDHLVDEGVEKITTISVVDFTWDNVAEQQFLQANWSQYILEEVVSAFSTGFQLSITGVGTVTTVLLGSGADIEACIGGGADPNTVTGTGSVTNTTGSGGIQILVNGNGDLI